MILLRHTRHRERGASLVEFVLSFLVVVFLVFWTFEMIMVMYTYSTVTNAAKEGVRYAIVHGSKNSTTVGDIKSHVRDFASVSLHDISAIEIQVNYGDGCPVDPDQTDSTKTSNMAPPTEVCVRVSYPFVPYIKLPWTVPTIHASAAGTIAN